MRRLIEHLTSAEFLRSSPYFQRYQPPRPARFADKEKSVSTSILSILSRIKIEKLYLHQAEALTVLSRGANPLIVTPTASGKSLIYQLAILEELDRNPEARFLLLFPLKALEQDQFQRMQELLELTGLSQKCSVAIVDGDTPSSERERHRAHPPNLILTNPDMLHYGILPYHRGWSDFFRNLSGIVIDELHIYRGIFGSHVLQVLRRLGRICRYYEVNPFYIAGSATIGNPSELAAELTGQEFSLIERSGAPSSGRHFLLLNPVESPYTLAARLFPEILKKGYKAIAFTKSRKATELLHRWILDSNPKLEKRISSYRAGFLPEERREIEKRLLRDQLNGVISTSALELGMDIGGIDVCLLLGYPGTISTMMQRAGRAGRGSRDSLVILIAGEDALDQYYLRHPQELFLRPSEAAVVDGSNVEILQYHLVCAAAEIPLAEKEPYLNDEKKEQIQSLVVNGKLIAGAGGRRWFPAGSRPHRTMNIRSVGGSYSIHDAKNGAQIGDIGQSRLWSECHPQAVYLHRSRQYLIEKIDDSAKTVHARSSDLDYYTQPLGEKETEILKRMRTISLGFANVFEGELKVTERLTGYQKRRLFSGELLSTHELAGPPQVMTTRGFWIEIKEEIQLQIECERHHFMGSLHASEHALISVFPLEVVCDRGDIGGISFTQHPQVEGAAIFIYDYYPGGLGITHRAFNRLPNLIGRTLSLVEECPCEDGCPSCVHSPKCGSGNRPLDKNGAITVLKKLLEISEDKEIIIEPIVKESVTILLAKKAEFTPFAFPRELPDQWMNKKILVFDLETQRGPEAVGGWGNTHLMGVSLAVVKDLATGECRTYKEEEIENLIEELFCADLVIGFNCRTFDYGVLSGYSGRNFNHVKTVDLLEIIHKAIGIRLSLEALAKMNLGSGKSGTGGEALQFYKENRWAELEEYCRRDVEITADLFYQIIHLQKLNIQKKEGVVEEARILIDLDVILGLNQKDH